MHLLGPLGWAAVALATVAVLAFVWSGCKRNLQYQIGRSSLRVKLGRLTVRRVPFADIERVDKPRRELRWSDTENWRNVFDDSRRLLVVHRRSGWLRKFVITPKHRYEFRRQLRAAVAEALGEMPPPETEDIAETDED